MRQRERKNSFRWRGLFKPDNIHLTQDGGYALYASKLKPVVKSLLKK